MVIVINVSCFFHYQQVCLLALFCVIRAHGIVGKCNDNIVHIIVMPSVLLSLVGRIPVPLINIGNMLVMLKSFIY